VLQESNTLLNAQTEMSVKLKPFETGSFIMDLALHVQQKQVIWGFLEPQNSWSRLNIRLNILGLAKKAGEVGIGLLESLKKLKNGKPESVEKKGDTYEYHAEDGATLMVSAPVQFLELSMCLLPLPQPSPESPGASGGS
jgi:hypothetical protein